MALAMISATQAQHIVLEACEAEAGEAFAIASCRLATQGDYWIIGCNSARFVLHGDDSAYHVGVAAYLVDAHSGALEVVGSAQSCEEYLQDKRDLAAAGDGRYILQAGFGRADKVALIRLHQRLGLPLAHALQRTMDEQRHWFSGRRRILQQLQGRLDAEGIATELILHAGNSTAIPIEDGGLCWEALGRLLQRKA